MDTVSHFEEHGQDIRRAFWSQFGTWHCDLSVQAGVKRFPQTSSSRITKRTHE